MACTLVFTHSPTPLAVFCRRRPLRAVQMVIMWTARLTDQWTTISHRVSRPTPHTRYYPIHANIAQYPIIQYRYRSNPTPWSTWKVWTCPSVTWVGLSPQEWHILMNILVDVSNDAQKWQLRQKPGLLRSNVWTLTCKHTTVWQQNYKLICSKQVCRVSQCHSFRYTEICYYTTFHLCFTGLLF